MATKVRVNVRDDRRMWDKLIREISVPKNVEVGIRGEDDQRHALEVGNVELGAIHEFGLGNVPERSFIRDTIDKNLNGYRPLTRALSKRVYTLKMSLKNALEVLGSKVQSDMRRAIEAGIPPALDPATIARKGSSKPLVDTGQLKASISYKVVT